MKLWALRKVADGYRLSPYVIRDIGGEWVFATFTQREMAL